MISTLTTVVFLHNLRSATGRHVNMCNCMVSFNYFIATLMLPHRQNTTVINPHYFICKGTARVQIKWRFSVEHYGVSHRCFVVYNVLEGTQELAQSSMLYGFRHCTEFDSFQQCVKWSFMNGRTSKTEED